MAIFRNVCTVEAVQVTAANFNGLSWDGCPFSETPDWLLEAAKKNDIAVAQIAEADYSHWRVASSFPGAFTIAGVGDWIVRNAAGGLSVYTAEQFAEKYEHASGNNLVDTLLNCRKQFEFYAESHRAKSPSSDTLEKARVNESMVAMIDEALAASPRPLGGDGRQRAINECVALCAQAIETIKSDARDCGRNFLHSSENDIVSQICGLQRAMLALT